MKQQPEPDTAHVPALRLLDERLMLIRQATGAPTSRGDAAAKYVADFVEDMMASGFVAEALQRHGVEGVSIAPRRG